MNDGNWALATNSSLLELNSWLIPDEFHLLMFYKKIWQGLSPSRPCLDMLSCCINNFLPECEMVWNDMFYIISNSLFWLELFHPVSKKYKLRAKCKEVASMPSFTGVLWLLSETSPLFLSFFKYMDKNSSVDKMLNTCTCSSKLNKTNLDSLSEFLSCYYTLFPPRSHKTMQNSLQRVVCFLPLNHW